MQLRRMVGLRYTTSLHTSVNSPMLQGFFYDMAQMSTLKIFMGTVHYIVPFFTITQITLNFY